MNKEEKKMIEEMAKDTCGCDYPNRHCENCWCREERECSAYACAKSLYEQNYRKVADDEIVIKKDMTHIDGTTPTEVIEFFARHNEQVRKETARDFAKTVISVIWEEEKDETIRIKDVRDTIRDILRMQFGIELEE